MKKQFVWIMTDSTRYDMLGCYGFPDMKTPYLDAMAARGTRFERVYTTQPVCGPARSCLFTGLFPHENGIIGNCIALNADVRTLGQRLSENGIECGYIGKYHLDGGDYFGNGVCPEGWNERYWYDMKCYLDELPNDDARRLSRRKKTSMEGDGIEAEFTFGHRVADRAMKFIEEYAGQDFFLTVSFDEPHGPSLCPKEYAEMYRDYLLPDTPAFHDTLENKPLYQRLWAAQARPEKARRAPEFLACNSYIDSEIGRVIEHVHALLPDAVILFTSDHGEFCGAHGFDHKGPAVYDEAARVPLLFEGPGICPGRVLPHTVSHADLPATVLDYMGLRIPNAFTGRSLMPVLQGGNQEEDAHAFIEFNRYERDHDGFGGLQPMRGIVTDRYKLALHLTDTDELYDIEKDPYNLHNLIDDEAYAAVRNALHDRVLTWMNETRDPFRGYQWKCRPWRTEYTPDWDVDGWTRQYDSDPGEYRQRDYDTGLTMQEASRFKRK
ncbi:MAG: sulfatase-like hydrolase/transferase [Clostridia bacterium]|nr:sulfatase-like hydrolase/transferase [Clostridia bacterium]